MKFGKHAPSETRGRCSSLGSREGTQWKFAFGNGYGASVINDGYGGEEGLYELAVLDSEGHITYQTPITDDVIGYKSEAEIAEILGQIAALTPEDVAAERTRRLNAEIDEKRAEIAKIELEIAEMTR